MKLLFALFFALQITEVSAQGHCTSNEVMYFSCKIEHTEKYVSICGSNVFGSDLYKLKPDAWLQFRLGKLGQPELIYPKRKKGSLSLFAGDYFLHKAVGYFDYNLWLVNGNPEYQIHIGYGDQGETYGIRFMKQEMSCENMSAKKFRDEGDSNDNFLRLIQALKARDK